MKANLFRTRLATFIVALAALVLSGLSTPASAAGTTTSTVVVHGTTFSTFYPDDICGPRASTETMTIRTSVAHITQHSDGSYSYQNTYTGFYHVDFVDPALADVDSQFTGVNHVNLTLGGTKIVSYIFHDWPGDIRIWERIHLTEVDGTLVVDRYIFGVTGCP